MDSIKEWLINVGLKTMGPSAARGAVLGFAGWIFAKDNLLSAWGVVSDSGAHTTTIYWDKLSIAVIAVLPALGAAFIKATQHHVTAAVVGAPQTSGPDQGGAPK